MVCSSSYRDSGVRAAPYRPASILPAKPASGADRCGPLLSTGSPFGIDAPCRDTVRLPLIVICACLILLTQYCISCECSTVLMFSWRVLNDTLSTDHRTSNYVCRTYYRTPDLDCAADVRSYDDCGNSDNTIDETCRPLRIPSLSIYL